MFICLYTLFRIRTINLVFFVHVLKNLRIYRHCINSNFNTFLMTLRFYKVVPGMLFNLFNSIPLLWVCLKNIVEQVFSFVWHIVWGLEVSAQNLFVQVRGVWVFKRQVTADECKQDYSAWPDIDICPVVFFSSDHLWRCVTWTSTCSLQEFIIFISIT